MTKNWASEDAVLAYVVSMALVDYSVQEYILNLSPLPYRYRKGSMYVARGSTIITLLIQAVAHRFRALLSSLGWFVCGMWTTHFMIINEST